MASNYRCKSKYKYKRRLPPSLRSKASWAEYVDRQTRIFIDAARAEVGPAEWARISRVAAEARAGREMVA